MHNYYNLKPPKWASNPDLAIKKLWSINAGGVTCGEAMKICNHIRWSMQLPLSLRKAAAFRLSELVNGRGRGRPKKHVIEVIQLAAHRK